MSITKTKKMIVLFSCVGAMSFRLKAFWEYLEKIISIKSGRNTSIGCRNCAQVLHYTAGSSKEFDLQSHRGGSGLTTVESTIASFSKGFEVGVSTLEMDVQITKDHQAVITHDPGYGFHVWEHGSGVRRRGDNILFYMMYEKKRKTTYFRCSSLNKL